MSLLGTPMCGWGKWGGGASLHPSVCVPSGCLSPPMVLCDGLSPAALTGPSCPPAVGRNTAWGIGLGSHPTLLCVASAPSLGTDPLGTVTTKSGSSPGRGEDQSVPHPPAGTPQQGEGLRGCILVAFASPATLISTCTALPIPIGISAPRMSPSPVGLAGGITGSILTPHPIPHPHPHPRKQPSSQAGCLLLLLPPLARAPRGWQENNSEEDE